MAAPLSYNNLDWNDRHFFDYEIEDDAERVAFINFFEHIERADPRRKRPRTGTGRIKLWRRNLRWNLILGAQGSQPFPEILRPTWIPPVASGSSTVPMPSSQPAAHPPQVLTLVAPITSGIVSIAPADVPPPHTLAPAVPVSGSIVQTGPELPASLDIQKRKRDTDIIDSLVEDEQPSIPKRTKLDGYSTNPEHQALGGIVETVPQVSASGGDDRLDSLFEDDQPSTGDNTKLNVDSTNPEHTAISRLTDIGGEQCPQFVLYNEVEMKNKIDTYKALAPSKEQRQFVQEALGGNYRFAKTLHQRSTRLMKKTEGGVPNVSTFLFAKVDDDGVIEDRTVIKCTDISTKDSPRHGQVERETTAANALQATNCRHVQQSVKIREGQNEQTLNFSIELLDDHPSWKLNYQASEYASHGTLHRLIQNHGRANQPIPEHFCWFVFGAIVDALITCQTGYCREAQPTPIDGGSLRPDWRRILHLDINPHNIFLSGPDQKYTYYQKPLLGSFDTALCLDPDRARHKAQFDSVRFKGTQYWQAPEQCMQYAKSKQYPPSKWELDHATDIYSLGLVIRYMMLCSNHTPDQLEQIMKGEADRFAIEAKGLPDVPEYEFPHSNYPSGNYSPALRETVQRCLAFRARKDPEKPNKKFRETLFNLRKAIDDNLAKIDQKHAVAIAKVQASLTHPKRTIFSEEDPRFAIGAKMPPVPQVDMADLTDVKAIGRDKKKALEAWEEYRASASREPRSMDVSAISAAFDDVNYKCREKFTKSAEHVPERRRLYFHALDHSMNTFQKCINPTGKFKQLRGNYDPDFFSPRTKRILLNQILGNSKILRREMRQELQKNVDERNDTQSLINQTEDERLTAENDRHRDEEMISSLRAKIRQLLERQDFKRGQETVLQQKISALDVLCEAASAGESILIFGSTLWSGEDVTEERGHWFPKLSLMHRFVWEYFWARPDGVFVDKVADGGNGVADGADELDDLIMQGIAE